MITSCLNVSGRNGLIEEEVSQRSRWPLKDINLNLARGECFPSKIFLTSSLVDCSLNILKGVISVIVAFTAAMVSTESTVSAGR